MMLRKRKHIAELKQRMRQHGIPLKALCHIAGLPYGSVKYGMNTYLSEDRVNRLNEALDKFLKEEL